MPHRSAAKKPERRIGIGVAGAIPTAGYAQIDGYPSRRVRVIMPIACRMHAAVSRAFAAPEVRRRLSENSLIRKGRSAEELAEFVAGNIAHAGNVAK